MSQEETKGDGGEEKDRVQFFRLITVTICLYSNMFIKGKKQNIKCREIESGAAGKDRVVTIVIALTAQCNSTTAFPLAIEIWCQCEVRPHL